MDRVMLRFQEAVADRFGSGVYDSLADMVPSEMQGYAGLLRGAFRADDDSMITVRLVVEPWDIDERWAMMVAGREMGPAAFWPWLAEQPACRIPFVVQDFKSQCLRCGDEPCIHGAALTYHWLVRVGEMPEFLLLLLNRRGPNRHPNVNLQPIARVPVVLGTNLDRTRRELVSILEAALSAAADERDNLFGGEPTAHSDQRD